MSETKHIIFITPSWQAVPFFRMFYSIVLNGMPIAVCTSLTEAQETIATSVMGTPTTTEKSETESS